MVSILYYTNNMISPDLLKKTLYGAIQHCRDNSSELIITSHFPLTDKYETVNLNDTEFYSKDLDVKTGNKVDHHVYKYLAKDLCIHINDINYKSFVVGKMPYTLETIFKQILLSIQHSSSDKIAFMEHDCLYPNRYINVVDSVLESYNMGYCADMNCILNVNGYFKIDNPGYFLSGCCLRKDVLQKCFERKIELINSNKPYRFEPMIDSFPEYDLKQFSEEYIINRHLCIDSFLDGPILDIKHSLNQNGMLSSNNYRDYDEYWGESDQYLSLFSNYIEDEEKKKYSFGLDMF